MEETANRIRQNREDAVASEISRRNGVPQAEVPANRPVAVQPVPGGPELEVRSIISDLFRRLLGGREVNRGTPENDALNRAISRTNEKRREAVAAANAERDAARQAAADTIELTNALQRIRELEGEITRLNGEIARLNGEITRHRSEADHAGLLNLEGTSEEFRTNAERMLDIRDHRIGNLVAQLLRAQNELRAFKQLRELELEESNKECQCLKTNW